MPSRPSTRLPLRRIRPPRHVLLADAAVRLRVSPAKARRLVYLGPLRATMHNGELVVAEADLAAYQRQVQGTR